MAVRLGMRLGESSRLLPQSTSASHSPPRFDPSNQTILLFALFLRHAQLNQDTMPSNSSREVVPEILDQLSHNDPAAQRSRRDLKRLNWIMGNERRVRQMAKAFSEAAAQGIVEIGAGDGSLTHQLAHQFPSAPISAYDLAPRPPQIKPRIEWHQGDLFDQMKPATGGLLVANLFLHHFEGDALEKIGQICDGFDALIFNEPNRARLPHALGMLGWPFVNHVTRHDMHVSIDAGFHEGELPALLKLDPTKWTIRETSSWRGGRCVVACRA